MARWGTLLLAVPWLYYGWHLARNLLVTIQADGLEPSVLAYMAAPSVLQFLVFALALIALRGERVRQAERRRRPSQASPRIVGLCFLAALSPLSYVMRDLVTAASEHYLLPDAAIGWAGYAVALVAWFLVDLARRDTFRLPGFLGLSLGWCVVARCGLRFLDNQQATFTAWPAAAAAHAVLFILILSLHRLFNRRLGGDSPAKGDGDEERQGSIAPPV